MKTQSIVIMCYVAFILLGGFIGYFSAHSLISLIAACISSFLLFTCSLFIWRGNKIAYYLTIGILFCLLLFFSYRFQINYKIAPSGIMTVLTGFLFIYLLFSQKRGASSIHI